MSERRRVRTQACGDCGEELEFIELLRGGQVVDAWWQHTDPASLCTPVL